MLTDPHFRARQSLVEVPDPEHGHITMPAVAPRLSDTPGGVRWAGPALGQHTFEVLAELAGLDAAELDELRQVGILGDTNHHATPADEREAAL